MYGDHKHPIGVAAPRARCALCIVCFLCSILMIIAGGYHAKHYQYGPEYPGYAAVSFFTCFAWIIGFIGSYNEHEHLLRGFIVAACIMGTVRVLLGSFTIWAFMKWKEKQEDNRRKWVWESTKIPVDDRTVRDAIGFTSALIIVDVVVTILAVILAVTVRRAVHFLKAQSTTITPEMTPNPRLV